MKKIGFALLFALSTTCSTASYSLAADTQGGSNCGVEAAADAALQQQIALIDAAKVNVPDFFSGSNSCINSNLLQSFNLSSMIPDLAGFMQGGLQNLAQEALNQAKQQVCSLLNEQLEKTIGKMRQAVGQVNANVGDELASMLGGATSGLQMPAINGIGQYDFSGRSVYNTPPYSVTPATPQEQFRLRGSSITDNRSTPSDATQTSPLNSDPSISDFGRLINGQ